jgi:hypothetical protein
MGWYGRYILPRVLDAVCGLKIMGQQRAKVVGLARGVVLEPGIGGGLNLPFYRPDAISKLIGVDPSIELGNIARQRSSTVAFPVELRSQSAELDAVAPESVDSVVFTYTFCEHARAPDDSVFTWQKRIEPLWSALAGGCHITRDAAQNLRDAAFAIDSLEEYYVDQAPRFAGFHQIGRASKRSS